MLKQAVHGFDEGVASVVEHVARDRAEAIFDRRGQLLERLESAAPSPAQPAAQVGRGKVLVVVSPAPEFDS